VDRRFCGLAEGRSEGMRFRRPCRTLVQPVGFPGVETPGYFRSRLRREFETIVRESFPV
jgi:hypothetical protein